MAVACPLTGRLQFFLYIMLDNNGSEILVVVISPRSARRDACPSKNPSCWLLRPPLAPPVGGGLNSRRAPPSVVIIPPPTGGVRGGHKDGKLL